MREVNVEALLNRAVVDPHGRRVGHLEEVCAARDGAHWLVTEYRIGAFALFHRLGGSGLGRSILRALGMARAGGGYRVPWDRLDLSDPARPRLLCAVEELEHLDDD